MDITLSIPVKKEIFKFLASNFPHPYKISLEDWLGIAIFNILKKQSRKRDKDERYLPESVYSEKFIILFSESMYFDYFPMELTKLSILQFNTMVNDLLKSHFIDMTDAVLAPKPKNIKEAIERFIDKNNIEEDDISYEAFKKAYYRVRIRRRNAVMSSF